MAKRKDIIIRGEDDREVVIPSYKQKTLLDHFVILMGVIFCVLFITVAFDCLSEKSVIGAVFDDTEYSAVESFEMNEYALVTMETPLGKDTSFIFPYYTGSPEEVENYLRDWSIIHLNAETFDFDSEKNILTYTVSGISYSGHIRPNVSIFDDHLNLNGFWIPMMVYSIILLACAIILIYLVTHYIIDYIEVFRALLKMAKNIKGTVETNFDIEEAFDDSSLFKKRSITVKEKDIIAGKNSATFKKKRIQPIKEEHVKPGAPAIKKKIEMPKSEETRRRVVEVDETDQFYIEDETPQKSLFDMNDDDE